MEATQLVTLPHKWLVATVVLYFWKSSYCSVFLEDQLVTADTAAECCSVSRQMGREKAASAALFRDRRVERRLHQFRVVASNNHVGGVASGRWSCVCFISHLVRRYGVEGCSVGGEAR